MTDLKAIAKDAAERVHKNGGCVPQMAFAPILFALQDALSTTPARAEAQDEGAAGEPADYHPDRVVVPRLNMKMEISHAIWRLDQGQTTAARVHMVAAQDILSASPAHPSPTPAADADRVRIAVEDALAELRRIPSPLTDDGDVTCWSSSDDVAAAIHAAQTHLERATLKSEGK